MTSFDESIYCTDVDRFLKHYYSKLMSKYNYLSSVEEGKNLVKF